MRSCIFFDLLISYIASSIISKFQEKKIYFSSIFISNNKEKSNASKNRIMKNKSLNKFQNCENHFFGISKFKVDL